ncbi:hypothetical protein N4G69_20680 [Streptomyces mirabilis]|uniref:hypothetical protein n=1 Tax=Streptomyces mirabilis TaxID=68239 RepID=UPI0021C029E9|nr:hypothetical protein [Streptomyces mirabilis]MCT9108022.1 hypothetical protein [Streptomyces mirabilis]
MSSRPTTTTPGGPSYGSRRSGLPATKRRSAAASGAARRSARAISVSENGLPPRARNSSMPPHARPPTVSAIRISQPSPSARMTSCSRTPHGGTSPAVPSTATGVGPPNRAGKGSVEPVRQYSSFSTRRALMP